MHKLTGTQLVFQHRPNSNLNKANTKNVRFFVLNAKRNLQSYNLIYSNTAFFQGCTVTFHEAA